jgi:hypothetical protein
VSWYDKIILYSFYFGPLNCLLVAVYLKAIAKAEIAAVKEFAEIKARPTDKGFMYSPNLFYEFSTDDQNYPF